jgi:signal transduction histidine kinase
MRLLKQKPSLMLLLVAALLALLPLLAVLQYHWLGEVSRGERERMRQNLTTSAAQFCQEFDRELTALFQHFQTRSDEFEAFGEANLAGRFKSWQATAAHPQLVKEIYQTAPTAVQQHALSRFNPTTKELEGIEWPESLRDLRAALARLPGGHGAPRTVLQEVFKRHGEKPFEQGIGTAVIQFSITPVNDELPGLIIPLAITPRPEDAVVSLPLPRVYRVVMLDVDYIKREFLPSLVQRHFAASSKDYHLAVIKRGDPQQIIYQSDAAPPPNLTTSDAADTLFKVRLNEGDRLFLAKVANTSETTRRPSEGTASKVTIHVERRDFKIASETAPPHHRLADDPLQHLLNRGEGRWQVLITHRAGSLDAAVAGLRRRNLATSFGILLLLGVSVGLIVLSSRRAQRLAAQQMEFVAGVSHELRTPLAVICSAAENLADGVVDNRAQTQRYGSLIRDEGRRLTGMVEQVLEFAGAQSGKQTYQLRPTELSSVIADALAACAWQLREGGFELEQQMATDLPMIKADAAALSRALQNLLSNAMKYSGASSWLKLNVEAVKTTQGEAVRIKVSDRGIGIAPAELPHIFAPFYRGQEVTAAQNHGNGLGLSLVKQIIEAHGGRVSVESKPAQGSTFTVHLPIIPALTPEVSKENYEQADFAR